MIEGHISFYAKAMLEVEMAARVALNVTSFRVLGAKRLTEFLTEILTGNAAHKRRPRLAAPQPSDDQSGILIQIFYQAYGDGAVPAMAVAGHDVLPENAHRAVQDNSCGHLDNLITAAAPAVDGAGFSSSTIPLQKVRLKMIGAAHHGS